MDEILPPRNGRRGRGRGGGRANRKRGAGSAKVFIENLDFSTSWQALKDHMRQVGKVKRADVFYDSNGDSSGTGMCEYLYAEDVSRAIKELEGSKLDGRIIRVTPSRGGRPKRPAGRRGPTRKPRGGTGCRIFVSNLPWETSWQDLKDIMRDADAGEVLFSDIYMDDRGRSKGSGVVEFEDSESAQRAISKLQNLEINGRNIQVREFREEEGGRKVFVGNLNWRTSWQDLKDKMREIGTVNFVKIFEDDQGRSKGSAIVEFENASDAQRAIEELHGEDYMGRNIQVREDREE